MAQAPTKSAIPPAPARGTNIHGQPNPPPPSPPLEQINIQGQPPESNMAPPEDDEPQAGLGDNTRAEMAAGRANLAQYDKRNNAEHEAGRHANRQRNPNN
jgi:hypothetical protein